MPGLLEKSNETRRNKIDMDIQNKVFEFLLNIKFVFCPAYPVAVR